MPNLSDTAKAALFAAESGEEFLVLVTLSHPSFSGDHRFASGGEDVISNSLLYEYFPFDFTLPNDSPDRPPRAQLVIDNVDRRIMAEVRQISGDGITVDVAIVLASDPDAVEQSFPSFSLTNISADSLTISGDLTLSEFFDEPYPARVFSPSDFPGLF